MEKLTNTQIIIGAIALSPVITLVIAWVIKSLKRFPSDASGFIRSIISHIVA